MEEEDKFEEDFTKEMQKIVVDFFKEFLIEDKNNKDKGIYRSNLSFISLSVKSTQYTTQWSYLSDLSDNEFNDDILMVILNN